MRKLYYSEFLRTYAEKLRVTIIILRIYAQIGVFGIFADVRRKTAQDYYHFSAHTQVTIVWSFCGRTQKNSSCLLQFCASKTIQCFGVSADIYTQILMLLKYDSCPNNTHDVLINQNRSFCGRTQILQIWMKNTPNLDEN